MALKKAINHRQLFALAFGSIVGVGWIIMIGPWIEQAGSLGAFAAFLVGGLVMMSVALCYAEIATIYPVAGGEVAYTYAIFGTRMSFVTGWFLALMYVSVTALEAISVGWVVSSLGIFEDSIVLYEVLGEEVKLGQVLLGLSLTGLIAYVNYRGAKHVAIFQEATTVMLLVVALIVIFTGFTFGDVANLKPYFGTTEDRAKTDLMGVFLLLATTPMWFAGFDHISQAMGEKSERSALHLIGWVMALSLIGGIIFYGGIVLSTSLMLPREQFLALNLPSTDAFSVALDSKLVGQMVLLAGLLGLITTWNSVFYSATRVLFALGRGHLIPPRFGTLHQKFGTPAFSVVFVGILGAIGTMFGKGAIQSIANCGGMVFGSLFFIVCLGVLKLRLNKPDLDRPYKTPGGLTIPIIAVVCSFGLAALGFGTAIFRSFSTFSAELTVIFVWAIVGSIAWRLAHKERSAQPAQAIEKVMFS